MRHFDKRDARRKEKEDSSKEPCKWKPGKERKEANHANGKCARACSIALLFDTVLLVQFLNRSIILHLLLVALVGDGLVSLAKLSWSRSSTSPHNRI